MLLAKNGIKAVDNNFLEIIFDNSGSALEKSGYQAEHFVL
jgi:hypothetical protein